MGRFGTITLTKRVLWTTASSGSFHPGMPPHLPPPPIELVQWGVEPWPLKPLQHPHHRLSFGGHIQALPPQASTPGGKGGGGLKVVLLRVCLQLPGDWSSSIVEGSRRCFFSRMSMTSTAPKAATQERRRVSSILALRTAVPGRT
jgi:hypothetical protein